VVVICIIVTGGCVKKKVDVFVPIEFCVDENVGSGLRV
jgi:hypothetical protein